MVAGILVIVTGGTAHTKIEPLLFLPLQIMEPAADINFEGMFPGLDHHGFRYVLHVCGLRELPAQTRLIEFEGIETVEDLANYSLMRWPIVTPRGLRSTSMLTCDWREPSP